MLKLKCNLPVWTRRTIRTTVVVVHWLTWLFPLRQTGRSGQVYSLSAFYSTPCKLGGGEIYELPDYGASSFFALLHALPWEEAFRLRGIQVKIHLTTFFVLVLLASHTCCGPGINWLEECSLYLSNLSVSLRAKKKLVLSAVHSHWINCISFNPF